MHVISSNRPLLSIPRITPFDIIVARTSLSIFTDLAVMIVVCAAMSAIGFLDYPAKPFDIVSGCILNWGLVYGFAFSNAVVSSRFDWWEKIWPTLLRIQYFTCGIFYHPTLMPNWAMNYLSWNPLVHVLEYFRQGYFRDYHSHFLDESYLVVWAVGALGVGLVLEASARNQLRQGR